MHNDLDLKVVERLSALETDQEHIVLAVQGHEKVIGDLKEKMTTLISEVSQVRKALYAMAIMMGLNVPIKDIGASIMKMLGH